MLLIICSLLSLWWILLGYLMMDEILEGDLSERGRLEPLANDLLTSLGQGERV